jgi:hypothetical protein
MTTAAALALAAFPLVAQNSGVSNPDPVTIDATSDAAPKATAPSKPSATKPATEEVYGAYIPYRGSSAAATVAAAPQAVPSGDIDAQIVTSVPQREGEINEGTLLRVRMLEQISTAKTAVGSKFTGEIMEAVTNNGRVIIPIGSIMEGQVTQVHSGRRISGGASLHLEPRSITLPDGRVCIIHAQLIDTTLNSLNVDREGTLKRHDQTKQTLAIAALTTGGGAAAGALIGGGVGAVVGAGVGAGASTIMWLKQDRQATLGKDSRLVFSLTAPIILSTTNSAAMDAGRTGAGPALKTATAE